MFRSLGLRRWLAWKLVQLAFKICNTEHHETLTVTTPDGQRIVEWLISGDAYGGGVFAQDTHGCPDGYIVEWAEKWPDYMNEDVDVQ